MLVEEFYSTLCGPQLTTNTAVAKDVGIYAHTLRPTYSAKSTFKKSSAPPNCLAVSDSHVFTAQNDKGYVHVYSRIRGNQEAFVPFPEKIKCLTLVDDVLILGTVEGRVMLWEVCTGRLISTPPSHVQAVSCMAATPCHLLTGSDDSNIHVWSLSRLLELDAVGEHEPQLSLSNHRAAVTAVVAGPSSNPETSLCISSSKDKTCIIWNYQAGVALRTLLFPSFPLCIALDPCARAFCVSTEDGSLFLAELFAEKPLIGPNSMEAASMVVQVNSPFGVAPADAGPASCISLNYDGTVLLSGHPRGKLLQWKLADNSPPSELANLNASISNIAFVPALPTARAVKILTIVKPSQTDRNYTLNGQLESDLREYETRFDTMLKTPGFSQQVLENAVLALQQPSGADSAGSQELQKQNEELWEIINEQRALQKQTLKRYVEAKSSRPS